MKYFFILLVLVTLAMRASAQSNTISKFAIAGGGGTSTGGVLTVRGTIGQSDASGPLSGGPYSLVGGFWALPSAVQTRGAPLLSVESLGGTTVRVYWPLPATGFFLDQTAALATPPATSSWSQVSLPYQTNATHISITVPSPTANKFYRLRKP